MAYSPNTTVPGKLLLGVKILLPLAHALFTVATLTRLLLPQLVPGPLTHVRARRFARVADYDSDYPISGKYIYKNTALVSPIHKIS